MTIVLGLAAACGSDPKFDWSGGSDGLGGGGGGDGGRRGGDAGVEEEDVCGKHSVRSDKAVPDFLIVLDKSGSMAPNGNETGTDRWRGSRDAVIDVTGRFEGGVNFGLMTYPDFDGQGGGRGDDNDLKRQCVEGSVKVPIGPGTGDAIANALRPIRASGYTPTASTLEAALEVIGTPLGADQGKTSPKYVLLVTDGDPNCSDDFSGVGSMRQVVDTRARQETIAAIEKLTEAGVQTYVVGYQTGASSFAEQLDKMAVAGGTGETKHHSVESGADLTAVFDALASRATSCSFRLAMPVDPTYVRVTVGKKQRDYQNAADGWLMGADRQTVSLTGTACADSQKGQLFEVEVECFQVIGI